MGAVWLGAINCRDRGRVEKEGVVEGQEPGVRVLSVLLSVF
jgi:hypothetical protein